MTWQLVGKVRDPKTFKNDLPKLIAKLTTQFGKQSSGYVLKLIDWEYPETVEVWKEV